MSKGKELYERYRALSKEEKQEFQDFLEDKDRGDLYELLSEFIKSKKA